MQAQRPIRVSRPGSVALGAKIAIVAGWRSCWLGGRPVASNTSGAGDCESSVRILFRSGGTYVACAEPWATPKQLRPCCTAAAGAGKKTHFKKTQQTRKKTKKPLKKTRNSSDWEEDPGEENDTFTPPESLHFQDVADTKSCSCCRVRRERARRGC